MAGERDDWHHNPTQSVPRRAPERGPRSRGEADGTLKTVAAKAQPSRRGEVTVRRPRPGDRAKPPPKTGRAEGQDHTPPATVASAARRPPRAAARSRRQASGEGPRRRRHRVEREARPRGQVPTSQSRAKAIQRVERNGEVIRGGARGGRALTLLEEGFITHDKTWRPSSPEDQRAPLGAYARRGGGHRGPRRGNSRPLVSRRDEDGPRTGAPQQGPPRPRRARDPRRSGASSVSGPVRMTSRDRKVAILTRGGGVLGRR